MMRNMRRGIPNLFKEGVKHRTGIQEAVLRNLDACKTLADMTRTSLGPNGMNKMVINHLEKIFVTSDTATLISEMEIQHPAAKMIVMAAAMQESEVGDGSNFVLIFAGELLAQAEELLTMGLHPSEIIAGYSKGLNKTLEILEELAIEKVEGKDIQNRDVLIRAVTGPIASKQYGYETFLAPLVAQACLTVMPKNPFNFAVDNVRVVKVLGGNLQQSEVIAGVVISHDTLGSIKHLNNAKVAVFAESIQAADTETKGTVLIHNADELKNFSASEEKQIESVIKQIADTGVNVVVTGGSVDEMAQHFLEKHGLMILKLTSKFELRRLCKATRARPLVNFGPVTSEDLGFAASVSVREVGSSKITIFTQKEDEHVNVSTILLRASTHNILNDIERAIDDGVNTIRSITRDGRFVAGAGAVDLELARRLMEFSLKSPGLEQYALTKFAQACEVVPRALAENSGHIAMDVLSQLYASHEKGDHRVGVNVETGGVEDMTKKNILDLLILKKQAIKLAVDAVLTVLRVDQIISAKPAGGPKMKQGGHWDDDD